MKIDRAGGWVVGSVLLVAGMSVLASDIDPALLCFKQCDFPKALALLIGSGPARVLVGATLLVLGLAFLVPLVRSVRSSRKLR